MGSLTQYYASSSTQGIGSDVRALVIGVQLNVPLYQGGAVSSRVREAVANQERARQDLENARRSAALQTREAYLGVTTGLGQVKALQQAVASTQLQLESTKLGQEVGVRTAVDVLNAEQQLSIARRDLAQAALQHHPEPIAAQGRGGQARRGGLGRHQRAAQGRHQVSDPSFTRIGLLRGVVVLVAAALVGACHHEEVRSFQGYAQGETIRLSAPYSGNLSKLTARRGAKVDEGTTLFSLADESEIAATNA